MGNTSAQFFPVNAMSHNFKCLFAIPFLCVVGSPIFAQQQGGSWSGYNYSVPTDPVTMLRLPQFEKELELVDDQKKKLAELHKESTRMQQEALKEFRSVSYMTDGKYDAEKYRAVSAEYQKARAEVTEKVHEKLADILLPHQLDRMREIQFQSKLKSYGVGALQTPMFADVLKITDEQQKELQEKRAEAQKKLVAEYAKMKAELQQEVLNDVLTKKQLRELEKLQGEVYEVTRPDYSKIYNQKRPVQNPVEK